MRTNSRYFDQISPHREFHHAGMSIRRFLNAETEQDNCLSTSGTNNALRFQGHVKLLSFRKLNSMSWDTILYHKEEREMD